MKRLLCIILAFAFTECSFFSNSCKKEFDSVVDILETKDSIVFPEKYKLLEEVSEPIQEAKQPLYNGSLKKFILTNYKLPMEIVCTELFI